MHRQSLVDWLDAFRRLRVAVVGDFFLDKYLTIDPKLVEVSLETGLEAHQVVAKRLSPGAAGTVAGNLSALGIGTIHAVTIVGEDGEGFELKAGLSARRISTNFLIEDAGRVTPTYTKPMSGQEDGSEVELNRQDMKNRTPTPCHLESKLIERLQAVVPEVDGVVVIDQVQERNCGVVTDAVRSAIAEVASAYPGTVFVGDARTRIGEYRNIVVKPNALEAARAVDPVADESSDRDRVRQYGERLAARTGSPVYVTMGADGILAYDGTIWRHARTIEATGPIDIVGAGDSATAAIVSALSAGAAWHEAAILGNIVASVTIEKLGTTGTASPDEVLERYKLFSEAGLTG